MTTLTEPARPIMQSASASRRTVCQVLHSLNVGGAEVLAYRIAKQLQQRFRFVFACLDEAGQMADELVAAGFPVARLDRKAGLDFACARRLAGFLRDESVDVVHAHQYTPFAYSVMSGLFRRRPPVLFNEHGRFHPDLPSRKRMVFNRLMLRRRDRVVTVGNQVRQAVIRNEGISGQRVQVIYNGVPLEDFAADDDLRHQVRNELNLTTDAFVIVQVARLDYLKDHATAIRTLNHVVNKHQDVQLLLIGDGPERDKIEQCVADLGLEPYVRLLGTRRDVPRLLSAADAFLLSSISEGIPVTLIEAMGARIPIVSTNVGGIAEVIVDGQHGLLAAAGDDEALASALCRLRSEPLTVERLTAAALKRAHEVFSEKQMHQQYARVYDEMIRSAR